MLSWISLYDFVEVMALFHNEEDTLREVAMNRLQADLHRMNTVDKSEADEVRKDKAKALAVMALSMMKVKAQKRVDVMAHEQRKRMLQRQKSAIGKLDSEQVRGKMRFKARCVRCTAAAGRGEDGGRQAWERERPRCRGSKCGCAIGVCYGVHTRHTVDFTAGAATVGYNGDGDFTTLTADTDRGRRWHHSERPDSHQCGQQYAVVVDTRECECE